MMRGVSGVIAGAVAALLVCCSADLHQGQDIAGAGEGKVANAYEGHKTRAANSDSVGGNVVRHVRALRPLPYPAQRPYRSDLSQFVGKRNFDEIDRSDLNQFVGKRNFDEIDRSDLNQFVGKRNFDEIDRSDLDNFIGKRNFDEIDQTSMPFPYAKRYYHVYGNNFLETPIEWRSYDKKQLRPEYPMDEIDLSQFPIGYKRSANSFFTKQRID